MSISCWKTHLYFKGTFIFGIPFQEYSNFFIFKPFLSPAFFTLLTLHWKSVFRLKMWLGRDLCLFQTYSLLHCHMTNSHLWQLLIGDHLENTLSLSLQADPDSRTPAQLNTQKSFAAIWTVVSRVLVNYEYIKVLNHPGFMDTTMCMWCNIQSPPTEFYKERGISIKHIRKIFSICVIQLNT